MNRIVTTHDTGGRDVSLGHRAVSACAILPECFCARYEREMDDFATRPVTVDMKRVLMTTAFLLSALQIYADGFELGVSFQQPRWGSGFAEAHSDPAVTVDLDYSPTGAVSYGVSWSEIDSEFRGFRAPDVEMRTQLVEIHFMREIWSNEIWHFAAGGGPGQVSHNSDLAEDSFGGVLRSHLDAKLGRSLALRGTVRRSFWASESSEIRNPTWSYGLGFAYKFP